MKKRIIALGLAAMMIFSATACRSTSSEPDTTPTPVGTEGTESEQPVSVGGNYKIGIITGTVSQGEEEFRQAEKMKEIYGDMIVTTTYPDNFATETETTIAQVASLASDPDVKVIVFVQAVAGASAAIDKVRETREDILFISGVPAEAPQVLGEKSDIVLVADEIAMGKTIVEQAIELGAENIVHYSFPRHLSYPLIVARRNLLKENSELLGINFVEVSAPDPTGDSGIPGAQQFIMEDVPRRINELGPDTVFFSTNCSMQEPLIKQVMAGGAMMVQQCCPSPYHAYPGALSIEIPNDKQGDVDFIIEEITAKVEEGGNSGRMGTWPVPINMVMVETGVRYGIEYCEGNTNGKVDADVLLGIMDEVAGGEGSTTVRTYDEDGIQLDNYFMILCDYIIF